MKPLIFMGTSLEELKGFPEPARREAGFDLWQVQMGFMPRDFKPMPIVGPGCFELRVHVRGEWRVMFCARRAGAVYVLHAFAKKTQATSKGDIEIARRRLGFVRKLHE
ncbi:MAG TPA: type II toxin-antitoxin system RelE/ParE family toxin [Povalibacter sp.]|uniref:type II toxin-antitoxin system RelE/ParE family toxin n=1 Tax=Povalibacter sp. TaxID=1962978 RepID=UPI002C1F8140|nr:type II toxin-antitoxin system RelE/ParE family toxin [Povalibacter sp.]HMN46002.1 type II toxin-antitoxin system RelE/ParE family toxin [Povalibacter sp.]